VQRRRTSAHGQSAAGAARAIGRLALLIGAEPVYARRIPIVFTFGPHEAPLPDVDVDVLVDKLRAEGLTSSRPEGRDVADAIETTVRGGDSQELALDRDAASAVRYAIHRLDIESHPLSVEMSTLRSELHRYLEDNPPRDDAPPSP
jgi:hypothetical protein